MAYYSVKEAVDKFINKYGDFNKAIVKAQTMKNKSSSENRYNFWLEVEQEIKIIKFNKMRINAENNKEI